VWEWGVMPATEREGKRLWKRREELHREGEHMHGPHKGRQVPRGNRRKSCGHASRSSSRDSCTRSIRHCRTDSNRNGSRKGSTYSSRCTAADVQQQG